MRKLTRKQEAELLKLTTHFEEQDKRRRQRLAYAKRVTHVLSKGHNNTNLNAEFLGTICSELDSEFDVGSQLCFEWMADYYIAREFERVYPWIQQIWNFLVENGHSERNKLEYFNDSEAFYVDTDRLIFVCGKSWQRESRCLVIDSHPDIGEMKRHLCWVRRVWRRRRLNCIGSVDRPTISHYRAVDFAMGFHDGNFRIYGDCRDCGHVLTYKNEFGVGKCDRVISDINEPLRFFFEINTLWTQTVFDGSV